MSANYKELQKKEFKSGKMRLSFPHLVDPLPGQNGGKAKFQFDGWIPKEDVKNDSVWMELYNHANAVHKARFDEELPPAAFFVDADLPNSKGKVPSDRNPECKGHYIIRPRSTERPGLVDQQAHIIPVENIQRILYPGCYVWAFLTIYPYNVSGNRGVSVGLQNMQKLAEGEPLSSRKDATSVFGAVAGSSEDESSYEQPTEEETDDAVNAFFGNAS